MGTLGAVMVCFSIVVFRLRHRPRSVQRGDLVDAGVHSIAISGLLDAPPARGMTPKMWKRELRRLGQRVLGARKGPVEPLGERLDVAALDGRAAPDAQARRSVAIM